MGGRASGLSCSAIIMIIFAGIYFCNLKPGSKFTKKSLANINEFSVYGMQFIHYIEASLLPIIEDYW